MTFPQKATQNFLYEVVPIRLILIVMLVFYHAFAIFSGAWMPIDCYPKIKIYALIDKLSYACLLETFVFISGYILGYQVRIRGVSYIQNLRTFVTNKFRRLMIPSIIFSVIYLLCFGNIKKSVIVVAYEILCGVGHMWFLPMLFWCFILIAFVEKINLSIKLLLPFIFLLMYFSILPFPFRFGSSLYYFLFFYLGYYYQRRNLVVTCIYTKLLLLLSFILFISFFILTCYLFDSESNIIKQFMTEVIYLSCNQNILKGIYLIIQITLRAVCACFGIFFLMQVAHRIVEHFKIERWNKALILSESCFGVYIFQQFILKFFNSSQIPSIINAYIYPWVIFIVTVIISLVITVAFRKTKLGKRLL